MDDDLRRADDTHPPKFAVGLDALPFDIKDLIIHSIHSPATLLSLGLCSKSWKQIIIPEYLEYRHLSLRAGRSAVWKHLLDRPDLARRIVSLKLMAKADPYKEQFPTTIPGLAFKDALDPGNSGPNLDMLVVLPKLLSLRRFVWLGDIAHSNAIDLVLEAIRELPELEHVQLGEISYSFEPGMPESPVWTFRNLRYFSLVGRPWVMGTSASWTALSTNLSTITELVLSYSPHYVSFSSCRFPSLIRARLYIDLTPPSYLSDNQITLQSQDETHALILSFLAAHPTIQHLSYYPLTVSDPTYTPGILPNLVSIHASHKFLVKILRDPEVARTRPFERLYQLIIGPNTMRALEGLEATRTRGSLRELRIHKFDANLEYIERLARVFGASVEVLEVNDVMFASDVTLTDVISTRALFPNLHTFIDSTLWPFISAHMTPQRDEYRKLLTSKCRKLRYIRMVATDGGPDREVVVVRTRGKAGEGGGKEWERGRGEGKEEEECEFTLRVAPGQHYTKPG